jgi:hypothetical protein
LKSKESTSYQLIASRIKTKVYLFSVAFGAGEKYKVKEIRKDKEAGKQRSSLLFF